MLLRVTRLRILDEKPSGSCTYPGCTCASNLVRSVLYAPVAGFDVSFTLRCQRTLAIHSKYIPNIVDIYFYKE